MAMMCNEELIFRAACDLVRAGLLAIDDDGIEPIHTYAEWKNHGYQVNKGEKAIAQFEIWNMATKKPKEGEEKGKSYFYLKKASFFKASQCSPIAG